MLLLIVRFKDLIRGCSMLRDSVAINLTKEQSAFFRGDAAHRHPPAFVLGSNTRIQDAYNVGWRISHVEKGLPGRGIFMTPSGSLLRRTSSGMPTPAFSCMPGFGRHLECSLRLQKKGCSKLTTCGVEGGRRNSSC